MNVHDMLWEHPHHQGVDKLINQKEKWNVFYTLVLWIEAWVTKQQMEGQFKESVCSKLFAGHLFFYWCMLYTIDSDNAW